MLMRVLWIRKYFFFIRIIFSFEFWIWIRILLDLRFVPDPTLSIQSFRMPTILKGFPWAFKVQYTGTFQRKYYLKVFLISYFSNSYFFDDFWYRYLIFKTSSGSGSIISSSGSGSWFQRLTKTVPTKKSDTEKSNEKKNSSRQFVPSGQCFWKRYQI
jgi:hypothetical protein